MVNRGRELLCVGREEAESPQREREKRAGLHFLRVFPVTCKRGDWSARVQLLEHADELTGLVSWSVTIRSFWLHQICRGTPERAIACAWLRGLLAAYARGAVAGAPPTSSRIAACRTSRTACPTASHTRCRSSVGQLGVAATQVRDRVHRNGTREQARMACDEEEGLVAAHAAPERVDPAPVDPEPGQRLGCELGHLRRDRRSGPCRRRTSGPGAVPVPSGLMTANLPTAGREPQNFAFPWPVPLRPCGEMTSGSGGLFFGPYAAGRSTAAARSAPLCAV